MKNKKPAYALFDNMSYAFRKHWRVNKMTVVCCAAAVVVRVAQPFVGLLMPKLVIDQIETRADRNWY